MVSRALSHSRGEALVEGELLKLRLETSPLSSNVEKSAASQFLSVFLTLNLLFLGHVIGALENSEACRLRSGGSLSILE